MFQIGAWALFVVWVLQTVLNFSLVCKGCSCARAEEKQKYDKTKLRAYYRSGLATPIRTPGHHTPGHHTPQYPGMPQRMQQPMGGPSMGGPHMGGPPRSGGGPPPQMMVHAQMAGPQGPHVTLGPVPHKSSSSNA